MSTRLAAFVLALTAAVLLGGCTTPRQMQWQREASVVTRDADAVADRLDQATQNVAAAADRLATAATKSAEAVAVISPQNATGAAETAEAINRVAATIVEAVRPLQQAAQTVREQPDPVNGEDIARMVLTGLQGTAGVVATATTGNPAAGAAAISAVDAIIASVAGLATIAGTYFGARGMAKAKAAKDTKAIADADFDEGYKLGAQSRA